jgi:peroxiredoxin
MMRRGRVKNDPSLFESIFVHRPHSLMLRDHMIFPPLTDLLALPPDDRPELPPIRFRYCGTSEVAGHPCLTIRGNFTGRAYDTHTAFVLDLATDRNDIPIRLTTFVDASGVRPLPTSISRCDDLREIAPGLWYPFRITDLRFENGMRQAQGWFILNSRTDITIDSVTPAPKMDDTVFRNVIAPAGSTVRVLDEEGQDVGQFEQSQDGVPSLTPARYLELLSRAPLRPAVKESRQKALDALIGKPAPEFPPGATWINGRPLTWQALRGQVVILAFWAEWSETCREDLTRLARLYNDGAKRGLTVVGVHPPGSDPPAIKKVMDALQLEFPICVDVPPGEGVKCWGELFGRFVVWGIPHAVAIDADGKVAACGRLEDVLARARTLVKEGR